MAKAYGYGVVKLQIKSVRKVNAQKAYDLGAFAMDPFDTVDADSVQDWIDCYKNGMSAKRLNGKKIEDQPHIREFFTMKDETRIPENNKTSYMVLEEFQAQRRSNAVLLKLGDVVGAPV